MPAVTQLTVRRIFQDQNPACHRFLEWHRLCILSADKAMAVRSPDAHCAQRAAAADMETTYATTPRGVNSSPGIFHPKVFDRQTHHRMHHG
jgi:hypothetical protein